MEQELGRRLPISVSVDQMGPATSSGTPPNRAANFRLKLRFTNLTEANITLVHVAAYLIASNGQVLTWTFSDAKDQPIAPNKGTVILMTESSTMQESLNPKVAYVIARIAQRPGEIELAIDEPLTQEAKQKKK